MGSKNRYLISFRFFLLYVIGPYVRHEFKGNIMRRVFLSFTYEDRSQVQGFKLLRWNKNVEVDFFDSSLLSPVQSRDPDYIKRCIRDHMSETSVTIVLISEKTHLSNWVNWEIEESIRQNKGILGIRLKDQNDVRIPSSMYINTVLVGNWNPDSFNDWIEQAAQKVGR